MTTKTTETLDLVAALEAGMAAETEAEIEYLEYLYRQAKLDAEYARLVAETQD